MEEVGGTIEGDQRRKLPRYWGVKKALDAQGGLTVVIERKRDREMRM